MHKSFYASGFLYNSSSQQILLQQLNFKQDARLVLFRKKNTTDHEPEAVFRQCVEDVLNEALAVSSIHPVYDYVHQSLGEHFIFFAEVSDKEMMKYEKENISEWVPIQKLLKYPMNQQTIHDITIGQRVIRSLEEETKKQT